MDPIAYIRRRSREEWQLLFVEWWTDRRIWVQENGEKAALLALVIGIVFVLFFQFIVGLLALLLIAGFVAWNIALPASACSTSSSTVSSSPSGGHTTMQSASTGSSDSAASSSIGAFSQSTSTIPKSEIPKPESAGPVGGGNGEGNPS